ncbi:MAG: hypothetical protein EOP06_01935 [Proteobacteria bacterium]|nr:MAG: hypothetical protein EOP06_01935 [Pseudomonadota bacterium]
MAVRFYRIEEKGGFKTPTTSAMIGIIVAFAITAFFFRNSPGYLFVIYPVEYSVIVTVLANPIRESAGWIMHLTRERWIVFSPVKQSVQWSVVSAETFHKAGLESYSGSKSIKG